MKNLGTALGLGTLAATLAAFDYYDPEKGPTGQERFDSPIVYDMDTTARTLSYAGTDRDFEYGEQSLRVLEAGLKAENGEHFFDQPKAPNHPNLYPRVTVTARRFNPDDSKYPHGGLYISGNTTNLLGQPPYVYMSSIALNVEGCLDDQRSQLQWYFLYNEQPGDRTWGKDGYQSHHRVIETEREPENVRSLAFRFVPGDSNQVYSTYEGPAAAARAESYRQLLKRVACTTEELLLKQKAQVSDQ